MSRRLPIAPLPCEHHKMMNQVMGYCDHADWMKKRGKEGAKQKQCKHCGRYLFPEEFNDEQGL
jgi:hypothetical protein